MSAFDLAEQAPFDQTMDSSRNSARTAMLAEPSLAIDQAFAQVKERIVLVVSTGVEPVSPDCKPRVLPFEQTLGPPLEAPRLGD
jgi:hypothetical protein